MGRVFQTLFGRLPDEKYIKLYWRKKFHRGLDLDNPLTFNEKLQWLKLYNRRPELTSIVDKATSKDYAEKILGPGHTIPTLALWDSTEDIDWDMLPNQFVLKPTHWGGGHGLVICRDKASLDRRKARRRLSSTFGRSIYHDYREWPYKDVRPRVIAEPLMRDDTPTNRDGLTDYKFNCFEGKVHDVMVCLDRATDVKFYFFDRQWNLLRINRRGKAAPEGFTIPKPEGLEEMFDAAEKLCQGFPFVRVDLYYINGTVYFGELTFFPCSGLDRNLLEETDIMFGKLLELPEKHE